MGYMHWRKIISSGLLASALLTLGTVAAYAQSAQPAQRVTIAAATEEPGVLIVRIDPDSPAAVAGLKRGDIVLAVDDTPVNEPQDLVTLLTAKTAGDQIALTVQHGDEKQQLTVELGTRNGRAFLGILPYTAPVAEQAMEADIRMTPGVAVGPASHSMISSTVGIQIVDIIPEGPAAMAGLQQGDLIVAIDDEPVTPETDLVATIQAHQPGDKLAFKVQRGPAATATIVTATLGQQPEQPTAAYLGVRVAPMVMAWSMATTGASPHAIPPFAEAQRFRFHGYAPHGYAPQLPHMPPMMMPFGYGFGMPTPWEFWWSQPQEDFIFTWPALPPSPEGAMDFFFNDGTGNFGLERPERPGAEPFIFLAPPDGWAPAPPPAALDEVVL